MLFQNQNKKLSKMEELSFNLEKDLQDLTEQNLDEVFGLEFVRSEFQVHDLRIDSLAFDPESKSFVIIEYKRDKNSSVIDQGFAYLGLLVNNKAEFILEYNQKMKFPLKREDIDWTQSKVIFISPQFTNYQLKAIHFKDLPIELVVAPLGVGGGAPPNS